jgi:Na+/melibiose symporter-like transporter
MKSIVASRNILLNIVSFCILLISFISSAHASFADKTLTSYFIDNVLVDIIIEGGMYSVAIILTLLLISYFWKKFGAILFSSIMALMCLYLLLLIYEVADNFVWIPS